jgi:hypothetical protein
MSVVAGVPPAPKSNAADTAASTVLVPEIGVIRRCLLSFPRNRRPIPAQYIDERPADFAKATTAKERRKAKTERKIKT